MQNKTNNTRILVGTSLLAAAAMTAIIAFTAGGLASRFDVVNEKFFAFYYPWQTRSPGVMAVITSWLGYAMHNILAWVVIFLAQRKRPKYAAGFRWFNWGMLGINAAFFGLHWLQTQIWYDGLAITVPEVTSQASVALMLVVVLILETPRRGLILGKKVKFHKRFMQIVRQYHGYLFSWAIIYTFWYHPMENTFGHLAGFFYMFLLLSQSVLLFNRAHVNKYWTFALEALVLVHGTLVAIYQGNGMWPMFAFGFGAMIVLTQMYGLGLSAGARRAITVGFIAAALLVYGLGGRIAMLHQVTWIPVLDYAVVAVLYLLFWGGYGISRLFRRRPAALKSVDLRS